MWQKKDRITLKFCNILNSYFPDCKNRVYVMPEIYANANLNLHYLFSI